MTIIRATYRALIVLIILGTSTVSITQENPRSTSSKKEKTPVRLAPDRVRVSEEVARHQLLQSSGQLPNCPKNLDESPNDKLAVVIGKDGKVQDVKVLSGAPKVSALVVKAVREWKFYTYFLNTQPTEVESTLNVRLNCP